MGSLTWIIATIGLAGLWLLAVIRHCRQVRRLDGGGNPRDGIVIFVEPVRWLFIIWGFLPFVRGLRRGGYTGQIRLFRWSKRAGALLVIPDLMRHERLLAKAARLARLIDSTAKEHPSITIHLCGYSSGCYLVTEAVGLLGDTPPLGTVILLSATVSPSYPMHDAVYRARAVHSFHSWLDCVINGLGPWVFGCNDRRRGLAAGMVGFRDPPAGLTQHAWSPRELRLNYFGDHFTVTSARFVAQRIAPLLSAPTPSRPPRVAANP